MRLHQAGVVLAALTLAMGIAAVNTGNNILFLLVSLLLSLLILSGFLAFLNVRALDLQVLEAPLLTAGETHLIGFRLSNRGRLPAFLLDLRLGQERTQVPVLPGRSRRLLWLAWQPAGRGNIPWPPIVLGSSFPFGFIWRGNMRPAPPPVCVAPAGRDDGRVLPRRPGRYADGRGQATGFGDWLGIRDHRPGEGLGMVVWRKVDWAARPSSHRHPPLPARHYGAEDSGVVDLDRDDAVFSGLDLESRLCLLRAWLDRAVAQGLPWHLRLSAFQGGGQGRQGLEQALTALALEPPLPSSAAAPDNARRSRWRSLFPV